MKQRLFEALLDVSSYCKAGQGYPRNWKAKSVAKLVEEGYVEDRGEGERPLWITDAGRAALAEAKAAR